MSIENLTKRVDAIYNILRTMENMLKADQTLTSKSIQNAIFTELPNAKPSAPSTPKPVLKRARTLSSPSSGTPLDTPLDTPLNPKHASPIRPIAIHKNGGKRTRHKRTRHKRTRHKRTRHKRHN